MLLFLALKVAHTSTPALITLYCNYLWVSSPYELEFNRGQLTSLLSILTELVGVWQYIGFTFKLSAPAQNLTHNSSSINVLRLIHLFLKIHLCPSYPYKILSYFVRSLSLDMLSMSMFYSLPSDFSSCFAVWSVTNKCIHEATIC